tara:strand:+ start:129 stop:1211 length:1083 start_codon:yes stop_codon:yes gene_type:complete
LIPVTKSYEPHIEDYFEFVQNIFESGWYTNRGNHVKLLEKSILNKLSIDDSQIVCMNNGTTPLQIALKLLGKGGDIITTPFSYVATTSSIVWENCTPIFVDIHPEYLTIDERKIESAITSNTTCILATHVFGNPCNVEEIEQIAKKHNLSVIYDAAHCFGVKYKGKSIFEYGNVSTCSFHATKLFHSGEGGAAFCNNKELFHKIFYSHNFGHFGNEDFYGLGINGKMSEFHAALGLTVLKDIDQIISSRKESVEIYQRKLNLAKISLLKIRNHSEWNYGYFPVIFESESTLKKTQKELNKRNIFPRRYFYPSLSNLPYIETDRDLNIAEDISRRILCLPLYYQMKRSDIYTICEIINSNL